VKENKFPKNLKKIRNLYKLSQSDLGEKISVSKQTISKYEKGLAEPNFHTLIEISRCFDCSLDSLVFGDVELNKKNPIELKIIVDKKINNLKNELQFAINNYFEYDEVDNTEFSDELCFDESDNLIDLSDSSTNKNSIDLEFYKTTNIIKSPNYSNLKNSKNFLKLPCIGNVSAGNPQYACEDIERFFYIPKKYLKYHDRDYFILRIKGESMNKLYKDGDYVLIHKTCCLEEEKPSVVLVNNEEATVKYVKVDNEYFYLQPCSDHPNFQKNIKYKTNENILNIVGTVVGVVFEEEV